MKKYALPLIVFLVIVGFLAIGLRLDPREVPSPFIGKDAPAFTVPQLHKPEATISPADLKGQVWLLNVWASWCVSCRAEHDELMKVSREDGIQIVGLNYKDERNEALQWLRRYGNPYAMNAFDREGRVGIDWGVYGTPETFLVDREGIIRYKQIGPINRQVWEETLRPLVQELKVGS